MEPQALPPPTPVMGCLPRMFWMFIGNVAVLFSLFSVARGPARALSVQDLIYAALVAGLVLARFLDIKYFAGETATGAPSTMGHLRRYAVAVTVLAMVAWLLVRAYAWHFGRGI